MELDWLEVDEILQMYIPKLVSINDFAPISNENFECLNTFELNQSKGVQEWVDHDKEQL